MPILNFLPLPLVQSSKFTSCPSWNHPRINESQLDGELKKAGNGVFIDSSPEFQPPLEKIIDFSEIDVILISNYLNMLALPYITERTNFKGVVYATEPTLQIARFFLEELVENIEIAPKANNASKWKEFRELHNLNNLNLELNPYKWKKLFDIEDVHKSLSRVHIAGNKFLKDIKVDPLIFILQVSIRKSMCLELLKFLQFHQDFVLEALIGFLRPG